MLRRLLVVVQTLCVSLKDTKTVSDCDAQKNMSMHYAGFLIIASYCTGSCDVLIYLFIFTVCIHMQICLHNFLKPIHRDSLWP